MTNLMILHGRLTKDVELKKTSSDIAFTEFTVAWSEKYKESETKCFLRCKAWRSTAENISKFFSKGKEIVISTPDSKVTVCVIPTNEEIMIARDTKELVENQK